MTVKRSRLLKHLESNGCMLHRHGAKHDIYKNTVTAKKTTVPRHPQIDPYLCDAICKQLDIPKMA